MTELIVQTHQKTAKIVNLFYLRPALVVALGAVNVVLENCKKRIGENKFLLYATRLSTCASVSMPMFDVHQTCAKYNLRRHHQLL